MFIGFISVEVLLNRDLRPKIDFKGEARESAYIIKKCSVVSAINKKVSLSDFFKVTSTQQIKK